MQHELQRLPVWGHPEFLIGTSCRHKDGHDRIVEAEAAAVCFPLYRSRLNHDIDTGVSVRTPTHPFLHGRQIAKEAATPKSRR